MAASPEAFATARELLRQLELPALLRHCPATLEDYEQITDEDLKCEFVDGELIVHSPASFQHENLTSFIIALLRLYIAEVRPGFVLGSNVVMQLGQSRFSPDASVLLAANAARIQNDRIVGPVDLAVEVLSASTRKYDTQTKLCAYQAARVPEIWLVDAEAREFKVHAQRGERYEASSLSTGTWSSVALPGLVITVNWFWSDPLPPLSQCRIG